MSSGASIIEPLIEAVNREVDQATISFQVARRLLAVAIEATVAIGWDKVEAHQPSTLIARYGSRRYVADAFRDNDIEAD